MIAILLVCSHTAGADAPKGGDAFREKVVQTAMELLGVSYRHGGNVESGFDCSGFVSFVYGRNGVKLPRTAEAQYGLGRCIELGNAKPGDLVFFRIEGARISHVGIYLGEQRFIHAPSSGKQVSVSRMDESYWQSRFAGAVSLVE